MKKTLLIVAVLVALICSAAVWSQGGWGGPGGGQGQGGPGWGGRRGGGPGRGGPGGMGGPGASCPALAVMTPRGFMLDQMVWALQLTDAQMEKLRVVTADSDVSIRLLAPKAADTTKALRTALLAPTFDVKKVKDLAAASEKAEAALVNARIDEWAKIRAILTAGQATLLRQMMAQPFGPGGRGPGGPPPYGFGGPPPEGFGGPPPGGEFGPPPPGDGFGPPPPDMVE